MKKTLFVVVLCFVLAISFFTACGKSNKATNPTDAGTAVFPTTTPVSSPDVNGVLRIPQYADKNINGKQFIMVIDDDTNTLNGTAVPGGFVVGTINTAIEGLGALVLPTYRKVTAYANVAAGSYYVYAFIDSDGSGTISGGDYVSSPQALTVSGLGNTAYMYLYPQPYTVKVKLKLPKAAVGKQYIVAMYSLDTEILKYDPWLNEPDIYTIDNAPLSMNFDAATFTVAPWSGGYDKYRLVAQIGSGQGSIYATDYPHAGDMYGAYNTSDINKVLTDTNITVDRDMEVTINMNELQNNIKGTMTLPAASNGTAFRVALSTAALNLGGTEYIAVTGTCGTSTSVNYEMFSLFSDTVYLTGEVDIYGAGVTSINPYSGDYLGICGTTVTNWSVPFPASPNTSIPGTGKNITLQIMP